MNVYTAEYLKTHEVLEECYPELTLQKLSAMSALRLRNGRARFLRLTGWTVKVGTTNYTDLARCKVYWLEAERLRR